MMFRPNNAKPCDCTTCSTCCSPGKRPWHAFSQTAHWVAICDDFERHGAMGLACLGRTGDDHPELCGNTVVTFGTVIADLHHLAARTSPRTVPAPSRHGQRSVELDVPARLPFIFRLSGQYVANLKLWRNWKAGRLMHKTPARASDGRALQTSYCPIRPSRSSSLSLARVRPLPKMRR